MNEPETDQLKRSIEGDRSSLEALLGTYGPAVRAQLERCIPSRFRAVLEAADVMQVTYLEAFLGITRRRPESILEFRNWLFRIGQNNLNDALKMLGAAKRGRAISLETSHGSVVDLPEVIDASTAGPRTRAGRNERATIVRNALRRLPADYRTVIELYDLDERPIQEVCDRLNRREGAIYMLRARAIDRLKSIFQDGPDLHSH